MMLFPSTEVKHLHCYSGELALLFAQLSELAYLKFETDLKLLEEPLKKMGLSIVATFNDQASHTQGYLVKNEQMGVLCFRGTEQDCFDILTDLNAKMVDEGHEGFFSSYNAISAEIEQSLSDIKDLPLYVTGHSLGGALAKVSVLSLSHILFAACYTFGSPAICSKEKGEKFKVPVFLIVNEADIVPRALSFGSVIAVLAEWLLKILRHFFLRNGSEVSRIDSWLKILKIMKPSLGKYVHFGERVLLTNKPMISSKDCTIGDKTFREVLVKDPSRTFEDHKIGNYIVKLKNQTMK